MQKAEVLPTFLPLVVVNVGFPQTFSTLNYAFILGMKSIHLSVEIAESLTIEMN